MLKDIGVDYNIALNVDGTMELHTDSVISGTWEPGVLHYEEDGESVISEYALVGDMLKINIADGEVELVFKRSSGAPPAPANPGNPGNQGNSGGGANGLSRELAWWDGDWYGHWTVESGTGRYLSMEGKVWDCYMTINAYDDNTATIFWYDDDMLLGEVNVGIGYESWDLGVATSVGGTLFDDPVDGSVWEITPGFGDRDDMFVINERYDDLTGSWFRYEVCMRPWGAFWDDTPASERPPHYSDWYIDVKDMKMDEAIKSGGDNSGGDNGGGNPPGYDGTMVECEVKSPAGKTGAM
jgi:hypothetical protein